MSRQKEPELSKAALYERLSKEDEQSGESNSITNQKKILENYAVENGFPHFVHYTDDGYSGSNFDRPAWKQMLEDIESGKIKTVIAKDLSRIGRNYLEVGFYTEVLFRRKGVRFIAVGNSVDSNVQESFDFVPILNYMNELLVRDCSRKIQAVLKARGLEGKHTTSHAIYGFKKDPENPDQWIIDEEAAKNVRTIYTLTIDGKGPYQIARYLHDHQVECPAYYLGKQGLGTRQTDYDKEHPYNWLPSTIARMIAKEEYKGCLVNFRYHKESYKDKYSTELPKEDRMVVENAHEAIVDEETWELAQKLRTVVRRTDATGEANPFTGHLFCADCGAIMYHHYYVSKKIKKDGTPVISDTFECKTYKLTNAKFHRECSIHTIRTPVVSELVLEAIRFASKEAREHPEAFIEAMEERANEEQGKNAKELKRKISRNKKRLKELDNLIRKLYESFATGLIKEKNFTMLSEGYEQEQEQLEKELAEAEAQLQEQSDNDKNIQRFLKLANQYTDLTKLTPTIINEFLDRVLVHEAKKIDGRRVQEIEIYLNFIGKVELPEPEPEQVDPVAEAKRLKHNEATRRSKAKRKAREQAEREARERAEQEQQEKVKDKE